MFVDGGARRRHLRRGGVRGGVRGARGDARGLECRRARVDDIFEFGFEFTRGGNGGDVAEDGGEPTRAGIRQRAVRLLLGEEFLAFQAHFGGVLSRRRRAVLLRAEFRQLAIELIRRLRHALELRRRGGGDAGAAAFLKETLSLRRARANVLHSLVGHGVRRQLVRDLIRASSPRVSLFRAKAHRLLGGGDFTVRGVRLRGARVVLRAVFRTERVRLAAEPLEERLGFGANLARVRGEEGGRGADAGVPRDHLGEERGAIGHALGLRLSLRAEFAVHAKVPLSAFLVRRHLQARVVHLALRGVQLALRRRDLLVEVFVKLGEFLVRVVELVSKRLATTNVLRHDRLASRLELPATLRNFPKMRDALVRAVHHALRLLDLAVERAHALAQRRRARRILLVPRAEFHRVVLLHAKLLLDEAKLLYLDVLLLLQLVDVLERLGVFGGGEDLVELFLERRRLAEGPVGILLVDEDDVLENRLGDAHHVRDGGVDVGALAGDGDALAGVLVQGLDHLVEVLLLELPGGFLRQLKRTRHHARLAPDVAKAKLDLRLDLGDVRHLRVVDERLAGARGGRELARGRHLQALDDRLGRGGEGRGGSDLGTPKTLNETRREEGTGGAPSCPRRCARR